METSFVLEDRETPNRLPPYVPRIDNSTIDALIPELTPQEIERLPWMLDVAIQAGLMDEAEAALWRSRAADNELVTVAG